MNRWRVLTIGLILISVGILSAVTISKTDLWQPYFRLAPHWMERTPFDNGIRPAQQPRALLGSFLTLYLSGVLLLFLVPERVRGISRGLSISIPGLLRYLLTGLLATVLMVSISLISAFSMSTFPLTFLLATILFLSTLAGSLSLAYHTGHALLARAGWENLSPLASLLVGVCILFAAVHIPWAGPVFLLIATNLGLGATIATGFGTGRPWSLNPLTEKGKE